MLAPWIMEETLDVNLNDERLNERLRLILSQLSAAPSASIPAACGGHAEMTAAYRFFDNDKVTFENVLEPHIEASCRRMAAQEVVLLVQDTSEIDLTRPQQQVAGVASLDGNNRVGALLHPLMGFTPDGTPLGTVYAEAWVRDDSKPISSKMKRGERQNTPIEEKESVRWVDALRQAQQIAAEIPQTKFITIADSEADIYELLAQTRQFRSEKPAENRCGWIVRACQNRSLLADDEETNKLRERLLAQPVFFTNEIGVRGRKPKVSVDKRSRRQSRRNRTAQMEVRSATVTLRPPPRRDRKLPAVTVNVVLATEKDPPEDEPAIEWMLLTSESVETVKDVQLVLENYTVRWLVEVFFRTLKSGCRIQERRFEHIDRVLPALAMYMIVTWRTLYVCRLGREFPDLDCEAIFEPSEWKSVYKVVTGKWPPKKPPTLQAMIRLVGQLGGYVNRPRSDEPGPQTIWIGLQRVYDMARCWDAFGPGARSP